MKAQIITDKHTITIHSPHDEITIQLSGKGFFEHFLEDKSEELKKTLDDIHEKARHPKPEKPEPPKDRLFKEGEPRPKPKADDTHAPGTMLHATKRKAVTTIKKCEHCGGNYKPRSNAQVYCSEKCKFEAKNPTQAPTYEHPAPGSMPSSAHFDPKRNPITGF